MEKGAIEKYVVAIISCAAIYLFDKANMSLWAQGGISIVLAGIGVAIPLTAALRVSGVTTPPPNETPNVSAVREIIAGNLIEKEGMK